MRRALLLTSALLAAGCAGPRVHSSYAVKPFDTDVALGSATRPVPATLPARPVGVAGFPTPFVSPPPLPADGAQVTLPPAPTPTAPRAKPACPTARSDSFPKDEAAEDVVGTPAAGTYGYRQRGFLDLGGTKVPLPPSVTRTVSGITTTAGADGSQRFDHTLTTKAPNGTVLTETYETITGSTRGLQDGIYLTRSEYADGSGKAPATFTPATPVLLMQLPADSATSAQGWKTVGTDPLSRTTLELDGLVGPRIRVDACGEVIAAWQVHLTGSIVTDTLVQTVDQTLAIATQYGGLVVATALDLTWTAGSTPVHQHVESTLNSLRPAVAR